MPDAHSAESVSALRRVSEAESMLTRAKTDRVLAWFTARRAGASDAEIARAAGVSRSTVAKRLGPR